MAAETQHDDVKSKVQSVREVVPGKSNNEIILVLQYYDNNVERTIQAYVEDGAKEALTQWHFSGNKTANKKKKKNKPKPTNQQQTQGKSTDQSEKPSNDSNHIEEKSITSQHLVNGSHEVHSNGDATEMAASSASTASSPVSSSSTEPLPPRQPLPQRQRHQHHQSAHAGTGQQAHITHHPRERTVSEQSASSVSSTSLKSKKPHAGLEKSVKDLQRQTISIERFKRVLNEEVERGCKRIKTVFEEMIQALKERESLLQAEMDLVRKQALETFAARQTQGADLKVRVDRAPSLNDAELAELRAEIKHFVADRKLDEDLGKTTRFLYDSDHLLGEIKSFGEVVPVRCAYTKRRPSAASLVSQTSEPAADMDTNPAIATGGGTSSTLTTTTTTTPSLSTNPSSSGASNHDKVMDVQEVADIQRRLKDSLRLQGVPVKSPPPRQGRQLTPSGQQRSGSGDHPRLNSGGHPRSDSGSQPRSGDHDRSKPGQRSGTPQRSDGSRAASGPGGDEMKKSRNAKRRQRQRERQREVTSQKSSNSPTHNSNPKPAGAKPAPSSGPNQNNAQSVKRTTTGSSPANVNGEPNASGDASQDSAERDQVKGAPSHRNRQPTPHSPKEGSDVRKKSPAIVVAPREPPVSRNSATVSINGSGGGGEKASVKRVEVIVNGDAHKN
ncbi:spermatogenesis-associated serine-rich protein 2-like isoform X2 [Liolophura sinensis]